MRSNLKYSDLPGLCFEEDIPEAPWSSSLKLVSAPSPWELFHGSCFSPVGPMTLVWDSKGIIHSLGFDSGDRTRENSRLQYPLAKFSRKTAEAQERLSTILALWLEGVHPASPLALAAKGTEFQRSVWRFLLNIPKGSVVSYASVAYAMGAPKAVRAVGNAVGANPIPLLIPCHRVIQSNGALANFAWGDDLKLRLLRREQGQGPG